MVLAGGRGRRLGGASKPMTVVGGQPMLYRVLAAVADAVPRVVVGPADLPVPDGVRLVVESGGGPVAGLAAGLSTVDDAGTVALLAADLPLLTNDAVRRLAAALSTVDDEVGVDGAVYVDGQGRRQILCGLWRTASLRQRLRGIETTNARLRDVLDGLTVTEVHSDGTPWYDCDSPDEVTFAEGKLKSVRTR